MGRSAAVGRFERATLEVDTNRRSGRATYMMTFRGFLGLVAIFGLFSMAAASPWFYHGLEGPSFTEKNTTSSGLEIRSYPESYWTATTVTGKYGQRGIRGLHATLQVHLGRQREER